jgi:hypothetical protein
MPRFVINGDNGDCIAAMPVIRQLGGAEVVFTQGRNPRHFRAGADMLKRLFESQPYITSVIWEDHPRNVTWDACGFRVKYRPDRTLSESIGDYFGVAHPDLSPWLTDIPPDPKMNGRILVSRTQRYNNPRFPWRNILLKFRNRLTFIGLEPERHALERIVGFSLPHAKVNDFFALAQLIQGSDLLICNQSCPYWIAAGLGQPVLQETETVRKIHDSIVPRSNAIHYIGGVLDLNNLPNGRHVPVIDFQI